MNHDHHPPGFFVEMVCFFVFILEDGKLQVTIWDVFLFFVQSSKNQIEHKFMVNVGKYTLHGWYGLPCMMGASTNPRSLGDRLEHAAGLAEWHGGMLPLGRESPKGLG